MGFDDFFENKHKHHNHGYSDYYRTDNHHYSSHSHSHNDIKNQLLNKLRNSPQFRRLLIIAAIIIILLLLIIIIALMPLILKFFHFVSQNGIKGLIDIIWKGTN